MENDHLMTGKSVDFDFKDIFLLCKRNDLPLWFEGDSRNFCLRTDFDNDVAQRLEIFDDFQPI